MKLIVGLGNPGRKYVQTRHNVGFEVLFELAKRYQAGSARSGFSGEWSEVKLGQERVILLWPLTYMNLSGGCVQQARDFYKLSLEDVLVVCDDLNLPLGKIRLRARGSSGGQKGLVDIIRCFGSEEFPRLRLGIGPVPSRWDAADFVLGKFSKEEIPEIEIAIREGADIVESWVQVGIQESMNRYN